MVNEHKEKASINIVIYGLVVVLLILAAANQYMLSGMGMSVMSSSGQSSKNVKLTGDPVQDAVNAVIPTGTPAYGNALGVSYDEPTKSLNIMAALESSISYAAMTPDQQRKYDKVGSTQGTACEFCCGLKTSFASNGKSACGCSHNQAFSGLTKWLIINEPDYSEQQIVNEVIRWKALFFPKQMVSKYLQQQVQQGKLDASSIDALPSMVGGC